MKSEILIPNNLLSTYCFRLPTSDFLNSVTRIINNLLKCNNSFKLTLSLLYNRLNYLKGNSGYIYYFQNIFTLLYRK